MRRRTRPLPIQERNGPYRHCQACIPRRDKLLLIFTMRSGVNSYWDVDDCDLASEDVDNLPCNDNEICGPCAFCKKSWKFNGDNRPELCMRCKRVCCGIAGTRQGCDAAKVVWCQGDYCVCKSCWRYMSWECRKCTTMFHPSLITEAEAQIIVADSLDEETIKYGICLNCTALQKRELREENKRRC